MRNFRGKGWKLPCFTNSCWEILLLAIGQLVGNAQEDSKDIHLKLVLVCIKHALSSIEQHRVQFAKLIEGAAHATFQMWIEHPRKSVENVQVHFKEN